MSAFLTSIHPKAFQNFRSPLALLIYFGYCGGWEGSIHAPQLQNCVLDIDFGPAGQTAFVVMLGVLMFA